MRIPAFAGSHSGRANASDAPFSWRSLRPALLWLAASLVFGWALAIVWWAALSPEARETGSDQLVIPLGTAASIANGTVASFVPAEVSLRPGSRLVVINNDTFEHTVGNAVIPPGAVAELTTPADGEGFYCTIHPSGFLGVDITERPPFHTTILPALLIGIPLGMLSAGASWVGRRLEPEPEADSVAADETPSRSSS